MKTWDIIESSMKLAGIKSIKELINVCGLPKATTEQQRRKKPEMFRGYELAEIAECTHMDDSTIAKMVKSMRLIIFFLCFIGLTKTAQAAPLTSEDITLIAKTVQAEAGNQDMEGKRLVAAVVLNRMDSEVFPDSVEGVLSQEGQFVTYRYLNKTSPTIYDMMAVQMELNERSNTEVMFFRTQRYGTGEPLMKVGDHYFSGLRR